VAIKSAQTKLAQGGPSDQMVLLMARREAEPHQRQPKILKVEFENNSRKLRDLTENRHSNSLKRGQRSLCQGKVKKGDDVADDEDDVVSTNVSLDRVTVTLCNEELFPRIQYI
jgi:hypothetical protein